MNAAAILVVSSTAILVYVLLVYPLLTGLAARLFPRPVRRSSWTPTVTALIPVRNGERYIERKIATLAALDYPPELLQVLFLSDGSTDRTADLIRQAANPRFTVLELPSGGKAAALTAGLSHATGEVLLFTDIRQELSPNALTELTAWLADPTVGVVSGELIIRNATTREEQNTGLYWKVEKWIRQQVCATGSFPGATGALYAMRRTLARPLPPHTLLDDVYLPLCAYFAGFRIVFASAAKAYDEPVALTGEFWRKVRTQAGVYQIIAQFPQLLWPVHGIWWHFVSHKLGRLLLPFALLTIAAATGFLPDPWRTILAIGQALFYAVAALGTPARTFVVLMAAALTGATILFRPARAFWPPAKR